MFRFQIFIFSIFFAFVAGQTVIIPPNETVSSTVFLNKTWTVTVNAPIIGCLPTGQVTFIPDSNNASQFIINATGWEGELCPSLLFPLETQFSMPIISMFFNQASSNISLPSEQRILNDEGFGFLGFNFTTIVNYFNGSQYASFWLSVQPPNLNGTDNIGFYESSTIPYLAQSSGIPIKYWFIALWLAVFSLITYFIFKLQWSSKALKIESQNKISENTVEGEVQVIDLEDQAINYISSVKADSSQFQINEKWAAYIKEKTDTKAKKFLIALFSLFPPLLQIFDLWFATYYIEYCYYVEDSESSTSAPTEIDYLNYDDCLNLNGGHLMLTSDSQCYDETMYYMRAAVAYSLLAYVIFFLNLKFVYISTKFEIKLFIVRAIIDHKLIVKKFFISFEGFMTLLPTLMLIGIGIMRGRANSAVCEMNISSNNFAFAVTLSGGAIIGALELIATYLAFFTLLYQFLSNPITSFINTEDLIENLRNSRFDITQVDYKLTSAESLHVVEWFYREFKNKEKEEVLLMAALQYLLDHKGAEPYTRDEELQEQKSHLKIN